MTSSTKKKHRNGRKSRSAKKKSTANARSSPKAKTTEPVDLEQQASAGQPSAPDAIQLTELAEDAGTVRSRVDELLVLARETKREKPAEKPVAPYISPAKRLRRAKRKTWRRQGFIEVSPGKPPLRHRILPRTVIGVSFALLTMSVGIAFSGAAFYAYYDNRLAQNEEDVSRFVEGFDQQFTDATGAIDDLRVEAIEDIRTELKPIGTVVTEAQGVTQLPAQVGPSVWALETRDQEGASVIGSAFAVLDHDEGTAFMTSYSVVEAAAVVPGPQITLVKGDQRMEAQLWSWDIERDLAIVMVPQRIPTLPLATAEEQAASVGAGVFAMGGVGGQGSTASPGTLLDGSKDGLQHTATVGSLYRGGPVINGDGKVLGLATLDFQPLGVDPGDVHMAPSAGSFCRQILRCAETVETVTVELAPNQSATAESQPGEGPSGT